MGRAVKMRGRQRLTAGLGATLMLLCAARPCSAFLSAPVLGPRAAPLRTHNDGVACRRRPADLALHSHGDLPQKEKRCTWSESRILPTASTWPAGTDGHGQSSGSEDSLPRRAALSDLGRRALAFPVALCLAGSRAADGAAVEVAAAELAAGVTKLDDVVGPPDAGGKSWLWKKLQVPPTLTERPNHRFFGAFSTLLPPLQGLCYQLKTYHDIRWLLIKDLSEISAPS
jgi:hypothetical protein